MHEAYHQPARLVAVESRIRNLGVMSLGTGDTIDIQDTSQLQVGDEIHIDFPLASYGHVRYGSGTILTVASTGSIITVTDPFGRTYSFQGGTKDALLARLRDLSDFDQVWIVRPYAGSTPPFRGRPADQPPGISTWAVVGVGLGTFALVYVVLSALKAI
jgi:hypothetical protein